MAEASQAGTRDLAGTGSDLDIESFAQKVAQEEDTGTVDKKTTKKYKKYTKAGE